MQTVLTYFMLLFTALLLQAQNTIEFEMINFDSNLGTVKVGLYSEEGTFLEKAFKSKESTIKDKKASVIFTDVADGIYAISCYHDEDSNGSMNMILGMIPSESYGCSNGAKGYFGPPKWEDAKFEVKNGEVVKQRISM